LMFCDVKILRTQKFSSVRQEWIAACLLLLSLLNYYWLAQVH